LTKAIYSDSVAGALKQFGKIGEDAASTIRLALFPLQFTAALQDRLAFFIDQSVRKDPEHRLVAPPQSPALEICERLKNCDVNETVASLYVELLARAIDKERVGEAHPAFVYLIGQLAPDEILFIRQLSTSFNNDSGDLDHVYVCLRQANDRICTKAEIHRIVSIKIMGVVDNIAKDLWDIHRRCVDSEELAQPEMFYTFLQHLQSMGIVEYTNNFWLENLGNEPLKPEASPYCIRLTPFGRLFYKACAQ
jgi:hypothetical protein